jgi:hypothetical protein
MGGFYSPFLCSKKFCIKITDMDKKEMNSRIIEIEMIIRRAMVKGHQPSDSDEFQPLRVERDILKTIVSQDYRPKPWK